MPEFHEKLSIAAFICAFASQAAYAAAPCESYVIQPGDTLGTISSQAFNTEEQYLLIYEENRDIIGPNPDIISEGVTLRIPCVEVVSFAPSTSGTPTALAGNMTSFVTANDFMPYADESLIHGGFFARLVENAMMRAAPDAQVEVLFVNDRAAHLEHLLPRQAFDASFPWVQPSCDAANPDPKCESYTFSDPFYEIVEGMFALKGSGYESALDFGALQNARVCRPDGYPTAHLDEIGPIQLIRPTTVQACFEQLLSQQVDAVAIDTRTGDQAIEDLGIQLDIAENPHLISFQTLRVAAHNANPKTPALIEQLNAGLRMMLESGEWNSIVTEGLATRDVRVQAN